MYGVFATNCACGKKTFDDATRRPVNFRVKSVFITISLIRRDVVTIKKCSVIRTILIHLS